jgi:hypothetical protein
VCALREIRRATDWRRRAELVLDPVSSSAPPAASSPCAHRFSLSPLCGLAFFSFAFPVCAFFTLLMLCVVVVLGKSNLQPICASPDLVGLGLCAEVRRRASGHHLHTTDLCAWFSPWVPEPREKGYCVHDLCGPVPEINNAHAAADGLSLSVFVFKLCPSIVIDLFMSGLLLKSDLSA